MNDKTPNDAVSMDVEASGFGASPETYDDLRLMLQKLLPDMASGQQRIARLFLDDPEGMAFRSIGDAAQMADVHRSSLVRFATKLGLPGYPALVELCRRLITADTQLVRRFENASGVAGTPALLTAVAAHDMKNIERTLAHIDPDQWEQTVTRIAGARVVYVVGMRKCQPVAQLLGYLLRLVRRDVVIVDAGGGTVVDEIRDVAQDDVMVAISIRRYSRNTVLALQYANERGAGTLALTDTASSPLALIADHAIYAATGSVTVLRSVTAFTSVVQALSTAVAIRAGTETREELLTEEKLLERFGTYLE